MRTEQGYVSDVPESRSLAGIESRPLSFIVDRQGVVREFLIGTGNSKVFSDLIRKYLWPRRPRLHLPFAASAGEPVTRRKSTARRNYIAPYRKPFVLASERSHFRVGDFPPESCIEPRNLRPARSRRKMEACPDPLVSGRTAGLPSISTGCSLALADLSKQPGVRS